MGKILDEREISSQGLMELAIVSDPYPFREREKSFEEFQFLWFFFCI